MFKVMSAPIPPVRARSSLLSVELEAIVMRGLSRDVAARFATAREMAFALEANAPSVRPSEIAAWVERIAGASLSQRASVLRAIEHEGEVQGGHTDAATNPLHQGAAAAWVEQANDEPGTGKRLREPSHPSVAQPSLSPLANSAQSPVHDAERTRRRRQIGIVVAAVLVALVLAATIEGGLPWTPGRADSGRDTSLVPARARLDAPARPSEETSARAPTSAPMLPAESALGTVVDAGVRIESPSVPASNDKRRGRLPRKNTKSCDPPYTTDEAGRVLFKVECM
jgi:serine/threonine-protein kinase